MNVEPVSAPHAAPTIRRGGLLPLLILLVGLGPLSTDLYLPSLPDIAADLTATPAAAQGTIGLFIAGFAVMMLLCGPLADAFGRRPILLLGLALFALASVGCALAPNIETLLALRFLQAVGACVGPVIGRAIVRDLYPPHDAGRILSYMASAMALAPLIAPFLGGWLADAFGWRACFLALALIGAGLSLAVALRLDETVPSKAPLPRMGVLAARYADLLKQRRFLGPCLCVAFAFGALFTWISNASFVVIAFYDVPSARFAYAFAVVVMGYVLGALLGARLTRHLALPRIVALGAGISALAGLVLLVNGWLGIGGLPVLLLTMAVSFFGTALIIPMATALALAPFPHMAGSAAALVGFVQMGTGFAINMLSGALFDGSARVMTGLNAACALLAVASLVIVLRAPGRRAPGVPTSDAAAVNRTGS